MAPVNPRTPVALRPLYARLDGARVEEIPFLTKDGTRLGLSRVTTDSSPGQGLRPAVLLLHGHTASSDMFLLPETRNLVEV
ncbi:esterase, partial [Streptomyces sp. MCAF7]